jgi:hypothetical protein
VSDTYTPPDAWLACAEKRELLRQAAANALRHNARAMTPEGQRWAEHWAKQPKLEQPLSTGEPMAGLEHLP